jgi:multidrug efflux system membrane fusion protein
VIRHAARLLAAVLALGACRKDEGAGAQGGAPGGGAAGAAQGGGGARGAMKFPVQIAAVVTRDVEYALGAVGSVEAFERVQVTSRVQGVVEKVDFTEGTTAQKGQLLVEIEPARYQLAVHAARAALEQASAQRQEAMAAQERREAVDRANPGLIPGEELASFRTRALTAAAEAQARRVALEQARLNLRDAFVRAPVAGVIETRSVQTGQYVQPGTVLATLVRRDPLLLRFKVPENDAARLRTGLVARFRTREVERPFTAKITYVGQAADPRSRMIDVTAEVNDERKEELRPGAFAEVTVPIHSMKAPVIPQTAVRPSERGFLAYVVGEGDIARERVVTLGMRTAEGLVEVKDGLAPGERLVIRGAEALRDGAEVRIAEGPDAPGSERPEVGARKESDAGSHRGSP